MGLPLLRTVDIYKGVVAFVALQLVGITLVALVPGMATSLPGPLLFSPQAAEVAEGVTESPSATSSGSPVAGDFSDLLDAPVLAVIRPFATTSTSWCRSDEGTLTFFEAGNKLCHSGRRHGT